MHFDLRHGALAHSRPSYNHHYDYHQHYHHFQRHHFDPLSKFNHYHYGFPRLSPISAISLPAIVSRVYLYMRQSLHVSNVVYPPCSSRTSVSRSLFNLRLESVKGHAKSVTPRHPSESMPDAQHESSPLAATFLS